MAVSLTVTVQSLRDTAARLKVLNRQLESELNTMSGRERVLNGMWDGQANDAFHAAYQHDVREYNDFIQAIEEYIRALLQAADEYERAEQRNQSIASGRSYGDGSTSTLLYVVDHVKFQSYHTFVASNPEYKEYKIEKPSWETANPE